MTRYDVWSCLLRGRCGIMDGSLDSGRKRASYSPKPTLAMITAVFLHRRITSAFGGERVYAAFRETIEMNNDTTSATKTDKRPGFTCFLSFSPLPSYGPLSLDRTILDGAYLADTVVHFIASLSMKAVTRFKLYMR